MIHTGQVIATFADSLLTVHGDTQTTMPNSVLVMDIAVFLR
jgi:hypothetical protein